MPEKRKRPANTSTIIDPNTPRVGQKTPEESQKTPRVDPKTPQVGPKTFKIGPKVFEGSPKTHKGGPKTFKIGPKAFEGSPKTPRVDPKAPKVEPKTPQVGPKTPKVDPKTPKVDPKTPKVDPKTPKVDPKTPKVDPKTPKVDPKTLQGSPKTPIIGTKTQRAVVPTNYSYYKKRPQAKVIKALGGDKKEKARGFVKKISSLLRHDNKKVGSPNHWHTRWENLYLHIYTIKIRKIIQKYYFQFGLYVHKLHILLNTGIVNVWASGYRVFKRPKAKLTHAKYKKTFKSSKLIIKFASFFIETNKVKAVHLNFYQLSLPRKYRIESGVYSFSKMKRLYYFKECLQLIYAIFKGYGSAYLLGSLIYTYTRRNPRRVAFLNNIQRLLVWHNKTVMGIKIQGVRVEVKGRFNAKSRAIKRILSIGCVKIHVKSSNVDFAQITSLTKFGSLGIKIWICPKNTTKLDLSRIMAKSPSYVAPPKSVNKLKIIL